MVPKPIPMTSVHPRGPRRPISTMPGYWHKINVPTREAMWRYYPVYNSLSLEPPILWEERENIYRLGVEYPWALIYLGFDWTGIPRGSDPIWQSATKRHKDDQQKSYPRVLSLVPDFCLLLLSSTTYPFIFFHFLCECKWHTGSFSRILTRHFCTGSCHDGR